MWNFIFLYTGLIFNFLILFVFLSRERIRTKENKFFLILTIINLIGYISEIVLQFSVIYSSSIGFVVMLLAKLYLLVI